MPKVTVDLTDEEYADLVEYQKHHPEEKLTPAEVLKQMAGTKVYRAMKQKTDPDRKKASFEVRHNFGIPWVYPCALEEILQAMKMTYEQFINQALENGIRLAEKALNGDKEAHQKFLSWAKETGVETLPPVKVEYDDSTLETTKGETIK